MAYKIKRLPIHPFPKLNDNISFWIEQLATANNIPFAVIFKYIENSIKNQDLVHILSDLTGVSVNEISNLCNDFKPNFLENPNQCPVQKCEYKAKERYKLIDHMANIHNIGVEWHECPHCDYKGKDKWRLRDHLANIHDIGVTWHECPQCEYRAKNKMNLKRHLACIHDINARWHKCPLCAYKTKEKSKIKIHLANIHDIDVKWHYCPHCDYKSKM